jgi:hypothetical protein
MTISTPPRTLVPVAWRRLWGCTRPPYSVLGVVALLFALHGARYTLPCAFPCFCCYPHAASCHSPQCHAVEKVRKDREPGREGRSDGRPGKVARGGMAVDVADDAHGDVELGEARHGGRASRANAEANANRTPLPKDPGRGQHWAETGGDSDGPNSLERDTADA